MDQFIEGASGFWGPVQKTDLVVCEVTFTQVTFPNKVSFLLSPCEWSE